MNIFFRYFAYRLKKSWIQTFVLMIFASIITIIVVGECVNRKYPQCGLYIVTTLLCILCTIMPILEFAGFNKKNNLDSFFSLPIRREKMALVHFFSGYLNIILIFTVCYIINLIYISSYKFVLGYYFPYYFVAMLLGLSLYSFFVFAFRKGRTIFEGVALMLFYALLVCFIVLTIDEGFINFKHNHYRMAFPYSPLDNYTAKLQYYINKPYIDISKLSVYYNPTLLYSIWGVIGGMSFIGLIYEFIKVKPESYGQTSESWFGFKTIIPIYGLCAMISIRELLFKVVILIAAVSIMMVRRQTVKLKKEDLVVLTGLVFVMFAAGFEI